MQAQVLFFGIPIVSSDVMPAEELFIRIRNQQQGARPKLLYMTLKDVVYYRYDEWHITVGNLL